MNPFADLIPQGQAANQNPFADLMPEKLQQAAPEQAVPRRMPGLLERAGNAAEEYVTNPIRATGYGIGKGLLSMGNYVNALVDPMFGTRFGEMGNAKKQELDQSFNQEFGEDNTPLKVMRGLGEFALPGGAAFKGASLATKGVNALTKTPIRKALTEGAIAGGLMSHIENPYDSSETVKGAALGATGGALGRGVEKGLGYAWDKYAQSAIPGLVEKATDKLKYLKSPESYASELKGIYQTEKATASKMNETLQSQLTKLDKLAKKGREAWGYTPRNESELRASIENSRKIFHSAGIPNAQIDKYLQQLKFGRKLPDDLLYQFRPDKFISTIKRERNALKKKIGSEPGLMEKYGESMRYLNEWLENPPKTWQEAMKRQEAINYAPKSYELKNDAPDAFLRGTAGRAREGLRKSIAESGIAAGEYNVGRLWPAANRQYTRTQEFSQVPGKSGELRFNRNLSEAMRGKNDAESAIFNEFLPKTMETGISKFQHLEKLFGNKQKMQEAAKSYYLRRIRDDPNYSRDVLDFYTKMSKPQRDYLFGKTEEGEILQAAMRALEKTGRPKEGGSVGHTLLSLGVPGGIGFLGALGMGESWDKSLLAGALTAGAAKGGTKLIQKTATPKSVMKALDKSEKSSGNYGRLLNALFNQGLGAN